MPACCHECSSKHFLQYVLSTQFSPTYFLALIPTCAFSHSLSYSAYTQGFTDGTSGRLMFHQKFLRNLSVSRKIRIEETFSEV